MIYFYKDTYTEHLNRMQIMNNKSRSSLPFKLQPFRGIIIITKSFLIEGLLWHGSVASLKTRNVNDAFDIPLPPDVTRISFSNSMYHLVAGKYNKLETLFIVRETFSFYANANDSTHDFHVKGWN